MNVKAFLPLLLLASLALYGAEFNPFAFPRTERSIAMEYYGLRGAEALSPTELQVVFGTSLGGDYDKPEAYSILSLVIPPMVIRSQSARGVFRLSDRSLN